MKKEVLRKKVNPLIFMGVAHRGLHTKDFTENGMKAFANAINNNVSFELDIHLTKDNQLVVCHDSDLIRTTGKSGIIEDLTLKEIKDNYRLFDGGEIPTFKELLDFTNERVPMVIELKVYKNNYKALAKKFLEVMKPYKNKQNYFVISFDPRALLKVRKGHFVRGLLVGMGDKWVYHFKFLFESLDLENKMLKLKSVQRYQKRHFVNAWTINNKEQFDEVYPFADTITFQNMDVEYVKEMLKKKNF